MYIYTYKYVCRHLYIWQLVGITTYWMDKSVADYSFDRDKRDLLYSKILLYT